MGITEYGVDGGDIRVSLESGDGAISAESIRSLPPYYGSGHVISTVRHLYNIRYTPGETFLLGQDINVSAWVDSFAPILEDFNGTLNGGNRAIENLTVSGAGLFANITGTVRDLTLDTPKVIGTSDNVGALAGMVSDGGAVSHITLLDPVVSGASNVGGVAGTVSGGTVSGVYAQFLKDTAQVSGDNNAGGLAGMLSGGTIEDSVVISPRETSPVAGTPTSGGLVGGYTTGTVARSLYLAVAPVYESIMRPIVGTDSVPEGNFPHTYYLSGKGLRPEREDYNRLTPNAAPSGDSFVPLSTFGLYDTFSVTGWAVLPGLTEELIVAVDGDGNYTNDIYPYPYFIAGGQGKAAMQNPNWPIVEDDGEQAEADILYYEIYPDSDVVWEDGPLSDAVVEHDGYGIRMTFIPGAYTLIIDDTPYTITLTGTGTVTVPEFWSGRVEGPADVREAWIFIPNAVLEDAYKTSGENITVTVRQGMAAIARRDEFNPLFAPAYGIRSPRHIVNINHAGLSGTYTQQLDVDFAVYYKEYGASATKNYAELNSAVVGSFTGTYDGSGKEVRNVKINALTGENIGLFAVNSGTVQNVAMVGASITGRDYVGGIAGRNAGTITRSFVGVTKDFDMADIDINAYNQVSGDSYVGGIAGWSSGTIHTCYVDFTWVGGESAAYVGGVAGYMDDGPVHDVFYNYGNWNPQVNIFDATIRGASATTGGLVGYINAGTLSNAYSTAFFGNINVNNAVVGGGRADGVAAASVLYLRTDSYNASPVGVTPPGTAQDVTQLRAAPAVMSLGGAAWARGSGPAAPVSGVDNPDSYTYPRLLAFGASPFAAAHAEPPLWPIPNIIIPHIAYYEIYKNVNTRFPGQTATLDGETVWYGLWGNDSADTLDYSPGQVVLEDGYVILTSVNSGNHFLGIRDIAGEIIRENSGYGRPQSINIFDIDNGFLLPLDIIEGYMRDSLNQYGAIYPVEVLLGQTPNNANVFHGYLNPLFAKSIYTIQDMQSFGANPSAQISYFQNTHTYSIRTPRHLNNIGFLNTVGMSGNNVPDATTLAGRYLQEIDIDFEGLNTTGQGYYRRNDISNNTRTPININNSIVSGAFTGTYTAASPYNENGERPNGFVRAIQNIGSTPNAQGQINSTTPDTGVFSSIGAGGTVRDLILRNNTVTGTDSVGGLAGSNAGTVRNIQGFDLTVTGTGGHVGGLVGNNTGEMIQCAIDGLTVTASVTGDNVGGLVGNNTGALTDASLRNASVTGTGDNVGGIAGQYSNTAALSAEVENLTVSGANNVGGVVGHNGGAVIQNIAGLGLTVTGTGNNVGGIAGSSGGQITGCSLETASFVTGGGNVGGIAGSADSGVSQSYTAETKVAGVHNVGGIAGLNGDGAVVEDVFFLSSNAPENVPVTGDESVGGIVGQNNGTVTRALYLAPTPVLGEFMYPIVGGGNVTVKLPTDDPIKFIDTCFYLAGSEYSLVMGEPWEEEPYNRQILPKQDVDGLTREGGGMGLVSEFIHTTQFRTDLFKNQHFAAWQMGGLASLGHYPYPLLTGVGPVPDSWPLTRGGGIPPQEEPPEGTWTDAAGYVAAAGWNFVNGDFNEPLTNPDNPNETYPLLIANNSNGNNNFNTDTPAHIRSDDFWVYYDYLWVPGWRTRPVNSDDISHPEWRAIEFQYPNNQHDRDGSVNYNHALRGRVRRDYKNGMELPYVELNAQVEGTLYQICQTTPGTQMYYSFYHAQRYDGAGDDHDKMNFLLSPMSDASASAVYIDEQPAIMRPCWTARGGRGLISDATINRVIYGYTSFYDPKDGTINSGYLYDMWVGDFESGYGITFYSATPLALADVPEKGYASLDAMPSAARDNVIGYWHVDTWMDNSTGTPTRYYSEWKRYYGLYTVPAGQNFTEFAYESVDSRFDDRNQGNYLAGIDFTYAGFAAVSEVIKRGGVEVHTVQPGDPLTVEVTVTNPGDTRIGNFVISSDLAPYTRYFDFVPGSVTVQVNGGTAGFVVEGPSGDKETLTITLPGSTATDAGTTLDGGQSLTVTFDIQVYNTVLGHALLSTSGYSIRNQVKVEYTDLPLKKSEPGPGGGFDGYYDAKLPKVNYSPANPLPATVNISDSIKLDKTVLIPDGDSVKSAEVSVKSGELFTIQLDINKVEGAADLNATGYIEDFIPEYFTVSNVSTLDHHLQPVTGGWILSVFNVTQGQTYTYDLIYNGLDAEKMRYGVIYTSGDSLFKYMVPNYDPVHPDDWLRSVTGKFPQRAVGLRVERDHLFLEGTPEARPGFDGMYLKFEDIVDIDPEMYLLNAAGYTIGYELILCDADGYPVLKDADEKYTVALGSGLGSGKATLFGSALELENAARGVYTLYYKIKVVAELGAETLDLSSEVYTITVTVLGSGDPCEVCEGCETCADSCECEEECLCGEDSGDPCEPCGEDCECEDGECECEEGDCACIDGECDCEECECDCDDDILGGLADAAAPAGALFAAGLPIYLNGRRQRRNGGGPKSRKQRQKSR
ncbi:MAG: hypothetical protein FWG93_01490 [Oscillospiraceae bacterium]|nr:hypothetical protein [Oscillospiraceae bacterium]